MAIGAVEVDIQVPFSESCASFDGIDDNIQFNTAGLGFPDPGTDAFSFTGWFRPNSQLDQTAVELCAATTNRFAFGIDNTGVARATVLGLTSSSKSKTGVSYGEWHHFAYTSTGTGGTVVFRVDDVASDGTSGLNNSGLTNVLILGMRHVTASPYTGQLMKLRLYNRALTSDEMTRSSRGEEISPGLIGKWNLKGEAVDEISGRTGTVSGAVFKVLSDDTMDVIAANRAGATDKYLITDIAGGTGRAILTATVQET